VPIQHTNTATNTYWLGRVVHRNSVHPFLPFTYSLLHCLQLAMWQHCCVVDRLESNKVILQLDMHVTNMLEAHNSLKDEFLNTDSTVPRYLSVLECIRVHCKDVPMSTFLVITSLLALYFVLL